MDNFKCPLLKKYGTSWYYILHLFSSNNISFIHTKTHRHYSWRSFVRTLYFIKIMFKFSRYLIMMMMIIIIIEVVRISKN